MAWGMVDIEEQRVRFVVSASRGERTMQELCREFEISRPTGYLWLRRYHEGGVAAVVEKSRRPHHSPERTARALEEHVLALRQQRPDWGARKLRVLLKDSGVHLPVITIHRILLREGLVRTEDRHRPAVQRFSRSAANQLWQMDFKGPVGWQAPAGPLSILDDHSRYAIALQGTWSTKAEPVKERLEEAFQQCGVPAAVLKKSERKFQRRPAEWDYEPGAEVRKISAAGGLTVAGRRWEISRALAGEWVQLVRLEQRILVYYCRSVVRELDLAQQRSTAVDRCWHSTFLCKGSPDNNV